MNDFEIRILESCLTTLADTVFTLTDRIRQQTVAVHRLNCSL